MTSWSYVDPLPPNSEIDVAAQRAQAVVHTRRLASMTNWPTKAMQNAPGLSPSTDKSLEEEAAETKRIDEMTLADYQRAIRKLDRKPWDKQA